jgi:hypothetical protein
MEPATQSLQHIPPPPAPRYFHFKSNPLRLQLKMRELILAVLHESWALPTYDMRKLSIGGPEGEASV